MKRALTRAFHSSIASPNLLPLKMDGALTCAEFAGAENGLGVLIEVHLLTEYFYAP